MPAMATTSSALAIEKPAFSIGTSVARRSPVRTPSSSTKIACAAVETTNHTTRTRSRAMNSRLGAIVGRATKNSVARTTETTIEKP